MDYFEVVISDDVPSVDMHSVHAQLINAVHHLHYDLMKANVEHDRIAVAFPRMRQGVLQKVDPNNPLDYDERTVPLNERASLGNRIQFFGSAEILEKLLAHDQLRLLRRIALNTRVTIGEIDTVPDDCEMVIYHREKGATKFDGSRKRRIRARAAKRGEVLPPGFAKNYANKHQNALNETVAPYIHIKSRSTQSKFPMFIFQKNVGDVEINDQVDSYGFSTTTNIRPVPLIL